MILLHIDDFKWGTAPIESLPTARRINIKDNETGLQFTMSWGGEPLRDLVAELIPALAPELAASILPALEVQSQLDPALFEVADPVEESLSRDNSNGGDD